MNTIKTLRKYLWLIIAGGILSIFNNANAQNAIIPSGCVGSTNLCCLVNTGINIGKFAIGISGGLALLVFVYGGFRMLISGGRSGEAEKGKKALINASIGLIIVLVAYLAVVTIVAVVTKGWDWQAQLPCQ